MKNLFLGRLGENIACQYIQSKKYQLLFKNFKKPFGEIDIIAKSKDGTLVFFEVKTIISKDSNYDLLPEDQMTQSKIKKLKRICEYFVFKNQDLINEKVGWRIDLIAILINKKDCFTIKHYENI